MAHGRQQVRDAIVTLVTGLTTTGTTVHSGRAFPHETLPSLSVYTPSEEVDEDCLTRRLQVIIEGRAKKQNDVDDLLDTIAKEVEVAIGGDPTLSGVALRVFPPVTTVEIEDEAEQPVGLITMEFPVIYRVDMSDPETLVN